MNDQTQQLQSLQQELIVRKSQMFDMQEQLQQIKQTSDSYAKALQAIVAAIGMEATGESVQLEHIVDAVKALVPEVVDEMPEVE